MRATPEKISSDPSALQLCLGILSIHGANEPVELGQIPVADGRRLDLSTSPGGRDATLVNANLASATLVALVNEALEELRAVATGHRLLERGDGELVIRALASERFDDLDCVVDGLHPLLALNLGLHVKRESRFLRFPREQKLIFEASVANQSFPRMTNLDDVVGEIVRLSESVLSFADASI